MLGDNVSFRNAGLGLSSGLEIGWVRFGGWGVRVVDRFRRVTHLDVVVMSEDPLKEDTPSLSFADSKDPLDRVTRALPSADGLLRAFGFQGTGDMHTEESFFFFFFFWCFLSPTNTVGKKKKKKGL